MSDRFASFHLFYEIPHQCCHGSKSPGQSPEINDAGVKVSKSNELTLHRLDKGDSWFVQAPDAAAVFVKAAIVSDNSNIVVALSEEIEEAERF